VRRALPGVSVFFNGRRVSTNRFGIAVIVTRFTRPGVKTGYASLTCMRGPARVVARTIKATWRDEARSAHFAAISESPRFVGRAVAALAADQHLQRRNGGSFSSGGLAREYGFTDLDGSRPDCWRYLVEVQEAGLPADPTGYR